MALNTPAAIGRHKYYFRRVDSFFLKLMIADICIGTVRQKPGNAASEWLPYYHWHCTLPCIPRENFNGSEPTQEQAQNALLDIVNAWFTVIDQ